MEIWSKVLVNKQISTLPLDLASITNLCSILRFHPVNVCSFGGVPVKSVQHHLQEKTFAGQSVHHQATSGTSIRDPFVCRRVTIQTSDHRRIVFHLFLLFLAVSIRLEI